MKQQKSLLGYEASFNGAKIGLGYKRGNQNYFRKFFLNVIYILFLYIKSNEPLKQHHKMSHQKSIDNRQKAVIKD
ncbi:hypothetical protein [Aquimarina addita]|uniref:hypothetical protein n=1 Tax=Aquimarina addita TaxID=870485 RepID=UPI0031EEA0E9